jgi:formyltetrahydrofolate synthetase
MTETAKILAAQIEVERTRAALMETVRELQQRLQPKTLASEAWEKAKEKGADLAEDAVDAVKSRPVAVGGVVAALTMFLAREPIKDAAVKLYDAMTSKEEPKAKAAALKPRKTAARAPARRPARKPVAAARKTEKAT